MSRFFALRRFEVLAPTSTLLVYVGDATSKLTALHFSVTESTVAARQIKCAVQTIEPAALREYERRAVPADRQRRS
ncbi:hypothetical protein [Paraburkholderia hospita]|uniref:hypothetical protein n=1 Tax=Paraburkholderia hospita TaxID=169430 RepID=UPI001055E45A|nr:hypothetical protein [Paraburkholderia hospita]